jgi:small subunit ribosomal protein S4e
MHQTRKQASKLLPIPRKGTKYIARALSNIDDSVPVVIALRDMLKVAKTAKEVRKLIHDKALKINGKNVTDYRQSIRLFNIFEADKKYELLLSPSKRFIFKETKNADRLCKVVNKRLLKKNVTQLNMHDGTNIITKEKVNVNDSVYIDSNSKIKKIVALEKGKNTFVISGKYMGNEGKIIDIQKGIVEIKIEDKIAIIKPNAIAAI